MSAAPTPAAPAAPVAEGSPPRPPRVLIVGENAAMRMGGEASTPYFTFKMLRERGVETWLLTHARCRDELRRLIPDQFDRITFLEDTTWDRTSARFASLLPPKIGEQSLGALHHLVMESRLRRAAIRLVRAREIDVVHEATPVSPKAPSALYGLGVPVVIGPLSGNMDYPPAFQYMQGHAARLVERVGRLLAHGVNRAMPGKLRADSLIVVNRQTRDALPRGARGVIYDGISEVSVDLGVWRRRGRSRARDGAATRFVYLGRLVAWKAVDLLLEAFGRVAGQDGGATLEILGDGPLRHDLEALAGRLGLDGRVHFAGWVTAAEGAARMADADVLVLPSLRESGGIVIAEAMALGLPVIATNWGGPGVHVDDQSGIRVEPAGRGPFIAGLAEAMLRLARSPELRAEMGEVALHRVATGTYTWDRKIDRFLEIYRETIDRPAAGRRVADVARS